MLLTSINNFGSLHLDFNKSTVLNTKDFKICMMLVNFAVKKIQCLCYREIFDYPRLNYYTYSTFKVIEN